MSEDKNHVHVTIVNLDNGSVIYDGDAHFVAAAISDEKKVEGFDLGGIHAREAPAIIRVMEQLLEEFRNKILQESVEKLKGLLHKQAIAAIPPEE